MNVRRFRLFLAAAVLLVGCEAMELPEEEPATIPRTTAASADADTAQNTEPETMATTVAWTGSSQSESSSSEPNSAEDASPPPDTVSSREKAAAGAGKKGRGYGGGPISEPARQYFQIRERTVFQIQIPHALKMYQAINGKGPADHNEFMEKIVRENSISLPLLPAGKKYVFDAEESELMIERTEE